MQFNAERPCNCSHTCRMTNHLVRIQSAFLLALAIPALAFGQSTDSKLDESLRESLAIGCVGTKPVIIRTKPGYREGLRASLVAHGDQVSGEFPALDALSAVIHCEDLTTLGSFDSTNSVSSNAPVGAQLADNEPTSAVDAVLAQANAVLAAAKAAARTAQELVRRDEGAVSSAVKQMSAAQKALKDANKAKDKAAAIAAASVKVAAAQLVLTAAQAALNQDRSLATMAQSAVLDAQAAVDDAQGEVTLSARDRKREGDTARSLKKAFFDTIAAQSGRGALDGSTIGVAVLDSGINPDLDFADRITAFYDFTNGDIRAVSPSDGQGHGSHVAGLAASQFVGVAPNARLIGLKVLDANGKGTTDNVVRAIEFAIANKKLLGIDVLNLSLGHPIFESAATDPLVQAVEHASRSGIVVVASVGNFGMNSGTGTPGYAGVVSPGNAPSALSVGAVRTFDTASRLDDRMAPYSSRGPSWYDGFAKPDFVAPGDNLLSVAAPNSALRKAMQNRGNKGDYMRLSGTSMAAAVVSGAVALVLEANPSLTPNAVKAILEYTAIPVLDESGIPYKPLVQGAGQIQIQGAVTLAASIKPSISVGGKWLATAVQPSTVIAGTSYAWSQSIIWGSRRLSGPQILSEQRPAWAMNIVWGNAFDGDNIVWGNAFDSDDNIVWGNNIVWGDHLIGQSFDDENIVWGNMLGDDDNIVWGNLNDDNIVWGNLFDDNIVWGNQFDDDNIVWGNATGGGGTVMNWSGGTVGSGNRRGHRGAAKAGVK